MATLKCAASSASTANPALIDQDQVTDSNFSLGDGDNAAHADGNVLERAVA